MTAGELIVLLQKVDPGLPVITEGCDCTGDVGGVHIYVFKSKKGDKKHIYLSRRNEAQSNLIEGYESFTKIE